MNSAKRIAFRQEIRRKQIELGFRRKRMEILLKQKHSNIIEQSRQFQNELKSIIHNLQLLPKQNQYYIHNGLMDLNILVKRHKRYLEIIIKQEYKVIEFLSLTLRTVNQNNIQTSFKNAIFQVAIQILAVLVQNQDLTSHRILQSGYIQELAVFMKQPIEKTTTLQLLFELLANTTRQCIQIANQYTRLGIPNLALSQITRGQCEYGVQDDVLNCFLFFLRCYFEQVNKDTISFSVAELNMCFGAASKTLDYLLTMPKMKQRHYNEVLQDSLKVFKQIINFETVSLDVSTINFEQFLEIIQVKNHGLNIKKEALHILDCLVYLADEQLISQMLRKQMLNRIWGVQEQLKHVVVNIMANVAIYPAFKTYVRSFLSQMKLQLKFFPQRKFTYLFFFNYFSSQDFQISGALQQSIVTQLWNNNYTGRQVLQIEAKIWLQLVSKNKQQRVPLRILEARGIPQVQILLNYIDGNNNNYMQQENPDLINSQ